MFPGQGAQQVNMGLELYEQEPLFRDEVNACCEILRPHLGFDLRAVLYPAAGKVEEAQKQITQTAVAQPALFTVEYALAQLWLSWGVRPQAMIGHSVGEYVAACLAGVFSIEDALKLVAARARMMQRLPRGRMIAVRLPESEVNSLLNKQLSLAAVNAPSLCVVSGPADSIAILERDLLQRDVAFLALQTSHAFHSAMVEPILKTIRRTGRQREVERPSNSLPLNITGAWIKPSQATDPGYWATHLRQTVRFADGIAELLKEQERALLEVGPGQTLSNLAKQHRASNATHRQRFLAAARERISLGFANSLERTRSTLAGRLED